MEVCKMKKQFFVLILFASFSFLSALQNDERLTHSGQYAYYRGIAPLIRARDFEAARERLDFLHNVKLQDRRHFYVNQDSLDNLEDFFVKAVKEEEETRIHQENQQRLLNDYQELERTVYRARDTKNLGAERNILTQLWNIGQQLDNKPAALSAHMVRLFQMAEFGLGGLIDSDLVIALINYLQMVDGVARETFDLMNYGDASGRRTPFPFERLFDQAKSELGSNEAHAQDVLKLLMIVGDETLRQRAEILLATGEDPADIVRAQEGRAELNLELSPQMLELPVEERVNIYIEQAANMLDVAYQLAVANNDSEAAAQLAEQIVS